VLAPRLLPSGSVTIERDSDEPVYAQLAAILRARIDSGEIPPRRAILGLFVVPPADRHR
jgi:hypothetical protein